MRKRSAVLIGCGNRGQMFGRLCREHPEQVQLVAVVDPTPTVISARAWSG